MNNNLKSSPFIAAGLFLFCLFGFVLPLSTLGSPAPVAELSIQSQSAQQLKPEFHELPQGVLIYASRIRVAYDIDYKIDEGGDSTITLIQRTNSDHIQYDYGNSTYSWILPKYPYCDCFEALAKHGKYWISPGKELAAGVGHEQIIMEDSPGGGYDWTDEGSPLQEIDSHESYTFWLLAKSDSTGEIKLLKRVDWSCGFRCRINLSAPLGHRLKLLSSDHVKLKQSDPKPGELAELIRQGVLGGHQCANRDRQLWRVSKLDGSKKLILTGTGSPPAGSIY